ncbi:MAG: ATP synthase F1 subunit epsilon [Lachnospiraceae bacterium]|nr:ATP synthase F1 subunit epsilon [Lachnospiraceae bacterium]
MADENKKFTLKIITPDRMFYEGVADMVEFNTTEGEIGIYKNHIPMTVIIKPGVLTITDGDTQTKAALHAGFVEILQDSVTILAEVIEWADEIDEARAERALDRAQERLRVKDPKTDMARAQTALLRAMARINAAK